MPYNHIKYKTEARVDHIVLARPEKRNAFNSEMVEELKDAVRQSANNPDSRALLISAEGKAFSAGADLAYIQELQDNSYEENLNDSRNLMSLFQRLYYHPKLIVAKVEGPALAGGCGLATLADFTFATTESQFGYTEARIGFVPAIVMVFLIRKLGESRTRELLLTGKLINAMQAVEIGLIYKIVSPSGITKETDEFIQKTIQEASGESIAYTRMMIGEVQNMPLDEALDYAAEKNAMARSTEDCMRGIDAFLRKEKLQW